MPFSGCRVTFPVSGTTDYVGPSVGGVLVRSNPTSVPGTLAQGVAVLTFACLEVRRWCGVRRTQSLPDEPDFRTREVTSPCTPIPKPRMADLFAGGERSSGSICQCVSVAASLLLLSLRPGLLYIVAEGSVWAVSVPARWVVVPPRVPPRRRTVLGRA